MILLLLLRVVLDPFTPSMFYVGQAIWDDIKNSWKLMGQLISIYKNIWDSGKVSTLVFYQIVNV